MCSLFPLSLLWPVCVGLSVCPSVHVSSPRPGGLSVCGSVPESAQNEERTEGSEKNIL